VDLGIQNGDATRVGSITKQDTYDGSFVLYLAERPGDLLEVAITGPSAGRATTFTSEGSEVRYEGRHTIATGTLFGEKTSPLCFRKAKEGWVYICGLGECVQDGKTNRLGYDRTVDSCLALLSTDDTILREGAARDLGRLAKKEDDSRVVPALTSLLNDSSDFVRRGAAEGLGLIGSQECYESLTNAFSRETNEQTKKFIEEALVICGGLVLAAEPSSARISDKDAAALYLSKFTREVQRLKDRDKERSIFTREWPNKMLIAKLGLRLQDVIKTLSDKPAASDPKILEASSILLFALKEDAALAEKDATRAEMLEYRNLARKDDPKAKELGRKFLAARTNDVELCSFAYVIAADEQNTNRDFNLAEEALDKAEKLAPAKTVQLIVTRGVVLFESGKREEGIASVKQALNLVKDEKGKAAIRNCLRFMEEHKNTEEKKEN
jgi:tetratricopeptide (TPR) repeat protein